MQAAFPRYGSLALLLCTNLMCSSLAIAAPMESGSVYLVGGLALDAQASVDTGEVTFADGGGALTEATLSKGRTAGTLALGYAFRPQPNVLLMLEIGKDFGNAMQINTGAFLIAGNQYSSLYGREWSTRRDWYLAFKPGLQINPSTVAYLSLAHHQGRASGGSSYLVDCQNANCSNTYSNATASTRVSGTGLGLGLQTEASGKWFARVEIERVFFSKIESRIGDPSLLGGPYAIETLKPSQYIGRALLGYRF